MIYANVKPYEGTDFGLVVAILDLGDHNPDSPVYIDLTGRDPQPLEGWYYDRSSDLFSDTQPPELVIPRRTVLASELWFKKFTTTERSTTWALCAGEEIPGITLTLPQRYRLASFRDMTLAGEPIPLHATETEAVIDALEAIGALDPGRADQILERT